MFKCVLNLYTQWNYVTKSFKKCFRVKNNKNTCMLKLCSIFFPKRNSLKITCPPPHPILSLWQHNFNQYSHLAEHWTSVILLSYQKMLTSTFQKHITHLTKPYSSIIHHNSNKILLSSLQKRFVKH